MGKVTVADILIIDNDKLLLAKRSPNVIFPNTWSIPGGTVNPNESIEATLAREIKKELGVDLEEFKRYREYDFRLDEGTKVRAVYFIGRINGKIRVDKNELSGIGWFEIDDVLLGLEYAFNQKEVISNFITHWRKRKR
jgi:ADP-ribose pyrophosphatase YjhB (NUDIX family)